MGLEAEADRFPAEISGAIASTVSKTQLLPVMNNWKPDHYFFNGNESSSRSVRGRRYNVFSLHTMNSDRICYKSNELIAENNLIQTE